jgi:hypothetical protein
MMGYRSVDGFQGKLHLHPAAQTPVESARSIASRSRVRQSPMSAETVFSRLSTKATDEKQNEDEEMIHFRQGCW